MRISGRWFPPSPNVRESGKDASAADVRYVPWIDHEQCEASQENHRWSRDVPMPHGPAGRSFLVGWQWVKIAHPLQPRFSLPFPPPARHSSPRILRKNPDLIIWVLIITLLTFDSPNPPTLLPFPPRPDAIPFAAAAQAAIRAVGGPFAGIPHTRTVSGLCSIPERPSVDGFAVS